MSPDKEYDDFLMNQSDLADMLGVTVTAINNWTNRAYLNFPAHKEKLGKHKLYDYREVARWHKLWLAAKGKRRNGQG